MKCSQREVRGAAWAVVVATLLSATGPQHAVAQVSACGNGGIDGTEECDDGNLTNGDGCSATCTLEDTSARCAGVPTFPGTELDAEPIAVGLRGTPVYIHAPPLDPSRIFIVERSGTIRVVKNGRPPALIFLDIDSKVIDAGSEQGLLSMAFHPDYEENGRFFINYINNDGDSVLAEYHVGANPDVAAANSEIILLTIDRPANMHNGGQLAFGPDGYLYFGMGDSGGGGDPLEVAQSDTSLLGKMLRLDVDTRPGSYVVPPSNPNAAAGDPLGLIWAKGLRNPWRFGFDRANGDLYIADVGQGEREEIDYQPATSTGGENYGWDVYEGTRCFDPRPLFNTCPDPPPSGFVSPVHEYTHTEGCSITGGYVYRGCAMPDLRGAYFYSDFCVPFIRSLRVIGGVAQDHQDHTADLDPEGPVSINSVTSFGEDARGELYIADYGGEVFKIVPQNRPSVTPTATPTRTGTRTRTPTLTPRPTATATSTRSATPTRTPTLGPVTATATLTPTVEVTVTPTMAGTATSSVTSSPTMTPSPSATGSPTPTETQSPPPSVTPTATVPTTAIPTRTLTPTRTAAATQTPTNPAPTCAGDCDGDGTVAINELVVASAIAFDMLPQSACPTFGQSGVGVSTLVRAVNNALNGCRTG